MIININKSFININKSFININKSFIDIRKSFIDIRKSFIIINKSFINIKKCSFCPLWPSIDFRVFTKIDQKYALGNVLAVSTLDK